MRTGGAGPGTPTEPDGLAVFLAGEAMTVDTEEIREAAGALRLAAFLLRGPCDTLALVGTTVVGGRVLRRLDGTGPDGSLAAAQATALEASRRLGALADRVEELADGLDGWVAQAEAHQAATEEGFGRTLLEIAFVLQPTIGLIHNGAALVNLARVAGLVGPGTAALPADVPYGLQVDQAVAGFVVGAEERLPGNLVTAVVALSGVGSMLSLVSRATGGDEVDGRVLGRAVADALGLPGPDAPPGTQVAQGLLPLVRLGALFTGRSDELEVTVETDAVSGLHTVGVAGGPLGLGAAVAGAAALRAMPARGGAAVGRRPVGPVHDLGDLVPRIDALHAASGAENTTHVEVLRTTRADGTQSFVVLVPGTNARDAQAGLFDTGNPMDNAENLEMAARESAAMLPSVREALELAGARPGDAIGVVGHSQGGLVAAQMAADAELAAAYDVRTSVSLGAPIAGQAPPLEGDNLAIEVADDGVPGGDGAPTAHVDGVTGGGRRTTLTVDTSDGASPDTLGQYHYPVHYEAAVRGAELADGHDPVVTASLRAVDELLGAGEEGARTESVVAEIRRVP
ncbi:MAG: hypothetical protein ACTHW4_09345 [Actinomycetales bacterium]